MSRDDVQRTHSEARERALEQSKRRCQQLQSTNGELRKEKDAERVEALQIIAFLRRDGDRKDELIGALKNTILQQRDVFDHQREEEINEVSADARAHLAYAAMHVQ
jgi:hypothetical protein|tara:strand:- start:904 stop:1221 length:318 start_codon:yes stop_codon:yes gene_type:complete